MLDLLLNNLDIVLILAVTAMFAGFIGGLLGIGGGLITVPILFDTFTMLGVSNEIAIKQALATSLTLIIIVNISSARKHFHYKNIDTSLASLWGPALVLGVIIGIFLTNIIAEQVLIFCFTILAIVAGINFWRTEPMIISDTQPDNIIYKRIAPFFIGCISSWTGIAGGVMMTPTQIAFGQNVKLAIGTSSFLGIFVSIPGSIFYILFGIGRSGLLPYSIGYVFILPLIVMVPVSMIVAPLGVKLSRKVSVPMLRRIFAVFLFSIAVKMLISYITAGV